MGMFPTTRWSVLVAGREDPGQARSALEYLCQAYRRPVLAYVRRRVASRAEAEDLTQSFFTTLIERRIDARADPLRGRFRALLLTSLKNFLVSAEASRCAAVRGGGAAHADFDASIESEAAPDQDPEDVFLRHWALAVLQRAIARMRTEAEAAGKLALFDALRNYLIEAPEAEDYVLLAQRFGMRSNTLAVAVHRLRQRLRDAVRDELAETVSSEADLDAELSLMRQAWGGVRRKAAREPGQGNPVAL